MVYRQKESVGKYSGKNWQQLHRWNKDGSPVTITDSFPNLSEHNSLPLLPPILPSLPHSFLPSCPPLPPLYCCPTVAAATCCLATLLCRHHPPPLMEK
ncbi:conserved hypothetical protein [Ricinus communis]|uniref:Uncharacterized protein n=1 Tax=Ricinus communis TaxID=3988 RepID=B9RKV3_RICCO|nr:conserved hypothetical protein [Ricinus communis]